MKPEMPINQRINEKVTRGTLTQRMAELEQKVWRAEQRVYDLGVRLNAHMARHVDPPPEPTVLRNLPYAEIGRALSGAYRVEPYVPKPEDYKEAK